MLEDRASGILLHPTSLPGPYGIGELGSEAFAFVDFLVAAKQKLWQVLPLGPTGYGDSPYASFSSFAGNPLLISLEKLVRQGLLSAIEVEQHRPDFHPHRVDFGSVIHWKLPLLRRAAIAFRARSDRDRLDDYHRFCESQAGWLDDYALFMAVKNYFDERASREGVGDSVWSAYWDRDIALREPAAMAKWRVQCGADIEVHKTWQYFFFDHWLSVKQYANERGLQIIGDIPIYVAMDSADVWSEPNNFVLDENRRPRFVAGVPPDCFSEDGQRWGNPVYNWKAMKQDRFRWWIRRFQGTRVLVDIIRLDHFRGFEAGWTIPASEPNAKIGEWVKAPGMELFGELRSCLGELPIVAEDLGLITPEVLKLRDDNGFPGMRVLQFAFDGGPGHDNYFLPHNYVPRSVVYTGTHDNDTTLGWHLARNSGQRQTVTEYLGYEPQSIAWDITRLAMASVAAWSIVPMQDLLELGGEARMNRPSAAFGNWSWRVDQAYRHSEVGRRLAYLVDLFDRNGNSKQHASVSV
jgi:4-alpha-glucanotransferase